MTEYDKALVERLRISTIAKTHGGKTCFATLADIDKAADRIEALSAEVERLREDRDTALDALFDAIALIGHSMPMHTEALIGGERMVARDIWQKGHDIMFPRAALEPKP